MQTAIYCRVSTEEQATEEVATNEQQTTQEAASTEEVTQEQQNEQTIQEQQAAYGKPSGQYDTNGPTYEEDENGNIIKEKASLGKIWFRDPAIYDMYDTWERVERKESAKNERKRYRRSIEATDNILPACSICDKPDGVGNTCDN